MNADQVQPAGASAAAAQQQAYAAQLMQQQQQYMLGAQWQQEQQRVQLAQMQRQPKQPQQLQPQLLQGVQAAAGADADTDLSYSRKPRPVEFQPYSLKDLGDKNWDVKKTEGYWELGLLGPEETEELQAKVRQNSPPLVSCKHRLRDPQMRGLLPLASGGAGTIALQNQQQHAHINANEQHAKRCNAAAVSVTW
jgi:hypothetical protein